MQGIAHVLATVSTPDTFTTSFLVFLSSIGLLLAWRKHRTPWLLISHLGLLTAAGMLFLFALNCALGTVTGLLAACGMVITRILIYVVPGAFALAVIGGIWGVPLIYRTHYHARRIQLAALERLSSALGIRTPACYALDTAAPIAFTTGAAIHLSTGLTELLSPKELEAVLLHELHHVQRRHAFLKFSALLTRVLSPVAAFAPLTRTLVSEEAAADAFAARAQRTRRHLASAKRKLGAYEHTANA